MEPSWLLCGSGGPLAEYEEARPNNADLTVLKDNTEEIQQPMNVPKFTNRAQPN